MTVGPEVKIFRHELLPLIETYELRSSMNSDRANRNPDNVFALKR